MPAPSVSNSITVRLDLPAGTAAVSDLTAAVEGVGGLVTAFDVSASGHDRLQIDVTCSASDQQHVERIVEALRAVDGVTVAGVTQSDVRIEREVIREEAPGDGSGEGSGEGSTTTTEPG